MPCKHQDRGSIPRIGSKKKNMFVPIIMSAITLEAVITLLLGAGSGGILWKLYDKYISHKRLNIDTETSYRKELKEDLDNLRAYVRKVEEENREAKRQYLKVLKDLNNLQISYDQLKTEFTGLKEKYELSRIEIEELKSNKKDANK